MIVYESNKNWLRDVTHLYKSWTMQKVLRSTLVVGLFTAVVCVVDMELLDMEDVHFDTGMFSLLGIVLSILLAFRTNTAYDRWWEGRQQWGALVNNSRNLAVLIHSTFPEDEKQSRHYLATRITNFSIALKEHLRKGVKTEELINISPEEMEVYKSKGHIPNYIAYEIYQRIQDVYRAQKITNEDHLNIKTHTQELLNIAGACERIRKTPIPFSYNVYLKIFISVYTVLLPLSLIPVFGYYAVPVIMLIFFAFIGLELMAEEIEDPFGLDCNDLPLGDISHTIKNNVFEVLESKSSIGHEHKPGLYEKIF